MNITRIFYRIYAIKSITPPCDLHKYIIQDMMFTSHKIHFLPLNIVVLVTAQQCRLI